MGVVVIMVVAHFPFIFVVFVAIHVVAASLIIHIDHIILFVIERQFIIISRTPRGTNECTHVWSDGCRVFSS